jgi:hypothetical protein
MIIRASALLLYVAAAGSSAAAQDIAGRYRAETTNQAGANILGTAEIVMMSENTCRIKWAGGSMGICMLKGATLAVSYVFRGAPGVGIYEISKDGTIEGTFFDDFHKAEIGREKLTPIR